MERYVILIEGEDRFVNTDNIVTDLEKSASD